MPLKIINSAVDTLECSFKNALGPETFEQLERLRNKGLENGEDQVFALGPMLMLCKPYGRYGFRHLATNEDFVFLFSPSKTRPDAYVQMNAIGLYEKGVSAQYEYLKNSICDDSKNEATTSRIDLCVDIQGFVPSEFDRTNFICRARIKKSNWVGDDFSGFSFGSKDMAFRFYNKSLEIKRSGKEWMTEIWKKNGYDPEIQVWRIEYQLRRGALQRFDFKTVPETLDRLDALWSYCLSWCSLRIPS